MITRVKFIGIPVRDQPAQLKFYTEKLVRLPGSFFCYRP